MNQMVAHTEVKENLARLDRLRHKFAEDEDMRLLSGVQDVLREAEEASKQQDIDAKDLIQSLVKRNAEVKAAAEYPGDSEAHARKLNEYKQVQQQARESLETAQGKILQVELVDQELENRALEVEDQRYELQQIQGELAPQAWGKLGLFLGLTKISWRSSTPQMISGTISDFKKNDIRQFDIDTTTCTKFEAIQQVWEHITTVWM